MEITKTRGFSPFHAKTGHSIATAEGAMIFMVVSSCHKCGRPMTEAQGGRIFTVCDDCWELPKQEPSGWRTIESAPKDGRTYILLGWFLEGGGGGPPEVAFWHSTKKLWCSSRFLSADGYYSPTHWQPLPEPPIRTL